MSSLMLQEGVHVWLAEAGLWQPCRVLSASGSEVTFSSPYGKELSRAKALLGPDSVLVMHETSVRGLEDMSGLSDLHEAAILYNIFQRYQQNQIYTYIGSILSAINPYKFIPGVYGDEVMSQYMKRQLGDLPPHIYAVANEVYDSMWKMRDNQCVLISGESGAGKTESTKFIIGFLSAMSQQALVRSGKSLSGGEAAVEEAIVLSSPILEAFGNAKTIYNNNSSRFGKFILLRFCENGHITGGKVLDYLLEKNRVVRQNPGERNYHIFYCLLAGADSEVKDRLSLLDPTSYYYLSQSGCTSDATINDLADYKEVLRAFSVMEVPLDQIFDILSILAAILHLGNATFVNAGGAQVADRSGVEVCADLLGLEVEQLSAALTQRVMVLRGEEITSPLTVEQACDSRDSLSMALYASSFRWVLERINAKVCGGDQFANVGILDIFGFENFKVNRFEQFNINFANEKLQEYFNKHIFSLEQHEYSKEGINWADIEWVDNSECLDLIERKLGVLDLLDEESRFPKGTDKTLLEKLHGAHKDNAFYVKPKVNAAQFGIKHYAGAVVYHVEGVLEKNRDTFRDDILKMLKNSSSDFVYDLFDHMQLSEQGQGGAGGLGRRMSVKRKGGRKKPTVSSQFKDSLHSLMSMLGQANPYFVRCIKPNMSKMRDQFEPEVVMNQLRYSGMMETVRIRRAGYPVRRTFEDFLYRYHVLARKNSGGTPQHRCSQLMSLYDPKGQDWQIGVSKMFMRESLERLLERERDTELKVVCQIIIGVVLTYIQRKRFLNTRRQIIFVQKYIRRFLALGRYRATRRAVVTIQKWERGRQARALYRALLEAKRIEEERRREEERRKEEKRREEERLKEEERLRELERLERELERLEQEQRAKEADEMRQKLEAEERLRKEELLARQKAEEEERLARQKADEEKRLARQKAEEEERQQDLSRARELEGKRERDRQAEMLLRQEELRLEEELRLARAEAERQAVAATEKQRLEELARQEAEDEVAALAEILELELEEMMVRPGEDDEDEEPEEDLAEIALTEAEDETRRKTFGETGADVFWSGEEISIEGFLSMKHTGWKRRWCIIKEETFMFFLGKQEALKQGWLMKKGGGTGTLSRRNWKPRYFVMRPNRTLCYYEKDTIDENTKAVGVIDMSNVSDVLEESGSKEFSFGIVTPTRTFHLTANNHEEKKEWIDLLRIVRMTSEKKIRSLMEGEVDPQNALGTIDLADIDSVQAINNPKKPNEFVVITANRVFSFVAADAHEMHKWISALSPRRKAATLDVEQLQILEKGWLVKEGRLRRRRYFLLTNKGLTYYRSEDISEPPAGTVPLNCLCSIDPLNEAQHKESGYFTVRLHARRHIHELSTKSLEDATKWVIALQDAIDSCSPIQTLTERLILSLIKSRKADWDKGYSAHPILAHTSTPIKAPLIALPYGKPNLPKEKHREYKNLHIEAVNTFAKLLSKQALADPIPNAQSILRSCFDLQDLRSEVFCQLIKQTAVVAADQVDSQLVVSAWQILSCMVCAFIPERAIQRYLIMHIKRILDKYPESEMAKFAEYCSQNMRRTKQREYPPSRNEIIACLGRRELKAVVHSYGGATCNIAIHSATTAQQVVDKLKLGMGIRPTGNRFGLFEVHGDVSRIINERSTVADVLAKFEQYREQVPPGEAPQKWMLFFKIFCFTDISMVPLDSVEGTIMFEQACDMVVRGYFPVEEDTMMELAALRQQYLEGDYDPEESAISDLTRLYPLDKIRMEAEIQKDFLGPKNIKQKYETISKGKNWLPGTLSRAKGKEFSDEERLQDALTAKMGQVRQLVVQRWKRLQGTEDSDAQRRYLDIVMEWEGFGCSIQDIKYVLSDQRLPQDLWLAIGAKSVSLFERGKRAPLKTYLYEQIESFGAPYSNKFKFVVSGEDSMLFETNHEAELTKLLNAHISFIMRQRRRSVSSTV